MAKSKLSKLRAAAVEARWNRTRPLATMPADAMECILITVFDRWERGEDALLPSLLACKRINAALRRVARARGQPLEACCVCGDPSPHSRFPMLLPCGHTLCHACIHGVVRAQAVRSADAVHAPCPMCRMLATHAHETVCLRCADDHWVVAPRARAPLLGLMPLTQAVKDQLERLEAARLDLACLRDVDRHVAASRTPGDGGVTAWWARIASALILQDNCGQMPRGLRRGGRITATRIGQTAQSALNASADPVFRACAARDERTTDVVFRELQRRAALGSVWFVQE
jgi:hypothetical protein